jgi:hypothetical protein
VLWCSDRRRKLVLLPPQPSVRSAPSSAVRQDRPDRGAWRQRDRHCRVPQDRQHDGEQTLMLELVTAFRCVRPGLPRPI